MAESRHTGAVLQGGDGSIRRMRPMGNMLADEVHGREKRARGCAIAVHPLADIKEV